MKVSILDDSQDTLRTLGCFAKLSGHEFEVWNDHAQDVDTLAERLRNTEALVLIRERTEIRAPLLRRLPRLRLISQPSVYPPTSMSTPAPNSGCWSPPACTRQRLRMRPRS